MQNQGCRGGFFKTYLFSGLGSFGPKSKDDDDEIIFYNRKIIFYNRKPQGSIFNQNVNVSTLIETMVLIFISMKILLL